MSCHFVYLKYYYDNCKWSLINKNKLDSHQSSTHSGCRKLFFCIDGWKTNCQIVNFYLSFLYWTNIFILYSESLGHHHDLSITLWENSPWLNKIGFCENRYSIIRKSLILWKAFRTPQLIKWKICFTKTTLAQLSISSMLLPLYF